MYTDPFVYIHLCTVKIVLLCYSQPKFQCGEKLVTMQKYARIVMGQQEVWTSLDRALT